MRIQIVLYLFFSAELQEKGCVQNQEGGHIIPAEKYRQANSISNFFSVQTDDPHHIIEEEFRQPDHLRKTASLSQGMDDCVERMAHVSTEIDVSGLVKLV